MHRKTRKPSGPPIRNAISPPATSPTKRGSRRTLGDGWTVNFPPLAGLLSHAERLAHDLRAFHCQV